MLFQRARAPSRALAQYVRAYRHLYFPSLCCNIICINSDGFLEKSTQSTKYKWNTKTMKTMKNKRIVLVVEVVLLLAMTATTLYG